MEAEAPTFQALEDFGVELIGSGHCNSPKIEEKLQAVRLERDDLEKAWNQRKKMLDQCLEFQVQQIYSHWAGLVCLFPLGNFTWLVQVLISFH